MHLDVRRSRGACWRVLVVAWLGCWITLTASPVASADDLSVTITPAKISPTAGESMRWVLRNASKKPIRHVIVSADLPSGMTLDIKDTRATARDAGNFKIQGPLKPGSGIILEVQLGMTPVSYPATVVAVVEGRLRGVPVLATATVELAQPPALATLTLSGGGTMTEQSAVEIRARITNTSNRPISVDLTASAGRHEATVSATAGQDSNAHSLPLKLAAGESDDVFVRAIGGERVRRETATVYVDAIATAAGVEPTHLSASKDVTVEMAGSDLLPSALGVGSALLVPGLLGVWAFLEVRRKDRKDRGLPSLPTAQLMWEDKILLLAAAAVSLLAIYAAEPVLDVNLLDAFNPKDLLLVTVVVGGLGALVSGILVLTRRHGAPVITANTDVEKTLRAAAAADSHYQREKYLTGDGKHGLLVRKDSDGYVLMPQVVYSRPEHRAAFDADDLREALKVITADHFNGRFTEDAAWISAPATFISATRDGEEPCLRYDASIS